MTSNWYGRRYPTLEDLRGFAQGLGAVVAHAPIGDCALYVAGDGPEPPMILLPSAAGPLLEIWLLAHELGHLSLHAGPRGALLYSKDEAAANRWAACALIPERRVREYRNASLDAFIAALSRHYQDIPPWDCPERALAATIAGHRLRCLEESA